MPLPDASVFSGFLFVSSRGCLRGVFPTYGNLRRRSQILVFFTEGTMGSLVHTISSAGVALGRRAATFGNVGVVMTRVSSMCHELHCFLSEYGRESDYILQAANFIGRCGRFLGRLSTILLYYSREIDGVHYLVNPNQESGLPIGGVNTETITVGQAEVGRNSEAEGAIASDHSLHSDAGINNSVDDGRNNGKASEQTNERTVLIASSSLSLQPTDSLSAEGSPSSDDMRENNLNLKRSLEQHACGNVIRKTVCSTADIAVIEKEENSSSAAIVIAVEQNASLAAVLEINKYLAISTADNIFRGDEKSFQSSRKLQE